MFTSNVAPLYEEPTTQQQRAIPTADLDASVVFESFAENVIGLAIFVKLLASARRLDGIAAARIMA